MAKDVTYQRADYEEARILWDEISDVLAGEKSVKAKGDVYLPRPNPTDTSKENQARYKNYVMRAVFYNATNRTVTGSVGSAFRKAPMIEVPESIDYLIDDVDGCGVSLVQQSKSTSKSVLAKGRSALLVDYPQTGGEASKAQMQQNGIRVNIIRLKPEQVINWRTETIGGIQKLVLVVIHEKREEVGADGFSVESIDRYRVLRLTEGVYTQEFHEKINDSWMIVEGPFVVTDGSGLAFDEIPIIFPGSVNNDAEIDFAPAYDLASLNLAHYRNSADYEDSAYLVGQPQIWMAGLTQEWLEMIKERGLYLGSRAPLPLPVDGAAGMLQAEANGMIKEAMDQKETQMIALGARLIQPGSSVKTATEAQGEQETEHSVLSMVCDNVSQAYQQALEWAARFAGVRAADGGIVFEINQDFVKVALSPQMLTALIAAWQSGKLPSSDLWDQLRRYGVIDPEKTDDEIKDELEGEGAGLGLGDEE